MQLEEGTEHAAEKTRAKVLLGHPAGLLTLPWPEAEDRGRSGCVTSAEENRADPLAENHRQKKKLIQSILGKV